MKLKLQICYLLLGFSWVGATPVPMTQIKCLTLFKLLYRQTPNALEKGGFLDQIEAVYGDGFFQNPKVPFTFELHGQRLQKPEKVKIVIEGKPQDIVIFHRLGGGEMGEAYLGFYGRKLAVVKKYGESQLKDSRSQMLWNREVDLPDVLNSNGIHAAQVYFADSKTGIIVKEFIPGFKYYQLEEQNRLWDPFRKKGLAQDWIQKIFGQKIPAMDPETVMNSQRTQKAFEEADRNYRELDKTLRAFEKSDRHRRWAIDHETFSSMDVDYKGGNAIYFQNQWVITDP